MPNVSTIRKVVSLLMGVLLGACSIACGSVTFTPPSDGGDLDGSLDTPDLDGPSITCKALTAPATGGVTVSNGGLYPSIATYTCDAGYGPSGATSRTCNTDGSWSGAVPICFSSGGGGAWAYRRGIPIVGSNAGVQNDYVVLVTVDTASLVTEGKMAATGSDIRFASPSGIELPWWIESGLNTSSTRLWVKVHQIPIVGTTIQLDYGNPSAVLGGPYANSGHNTFELFDDFETTALDPARWSAGQAYRLPAQQSGLLHFYEWTCCNGQLGAEEAQTAMTFAGSKAVEFSMARNSAPESSWKSQQFLARIGAASTVSTAPIAKVASGWWSNGVQDCAAANGSYPGRIQVDTKGGTFKLFLGDTLCGSSSISALTSSYVFNFALEGGWGSDTVDFLDFRVRSFVSPEPVAGIPGPEQGT
jgi:hypothetical protein